MEEFEFIPEIDPVTARVRDLVALGLASKETAGTSAEATDCLNAAMALIVTELDRMLTPTPADLHVIHGGKH